MTYETINPAPSLMLMAVMDGMEKAADMPFTTIDETKQHVDYLVTILLEDAPRFKNEIRVFVAESAVDDFAAAVILVRNKKMEMPVTLARITCYPQEGDEPQAGKVELSDPTFNGDVFTWADYYFKNRLNSLIPLMDTYDHFTNHCKESRINTISIRDFRTALNFWASERGYCFNPKEMQNGKGRILKSVFEKSMDMIYIRKGGNDE